METNFSAKEINRVRLSGSSLAETPGHGERLNSSPIISLRIWIEYKLDIISLFFDLWIVRCCLQNNNDKSIRFLVHPLVLQPTKTKNEGFVQW